MRLSGKVQNVTSFGVFVDIGVGVNGLIHKTKMKDSILCGTALCAGNTVEAEVLEVDRRKNRISLSLVSVLERSTVNLR